MDKMMVSSRFTPQRYDFQKNLQNFCDCFLEKSTPKAIFCNLHLTFRIVGQLPTHQKIRLENCPSSCILLFRCGQREQVLAGNWKLAGTHMGASGHADGSWRARRWEPTGTQMEAGGHADGSWRQHPYLRLPLHRLRKISSTKVGTPTPLLLDDGS